MSDDAQHSMKIQTNLPFRVCQSADIITTLFPKGTDECVCGYCMSQDQYIFL